MQSTITNHVLCIFILNPIPKFKPALIKAEE